MYQKNTTTTGMPKRLYHKILLIMRLTAVLLLATLLQVSAASYAQRITMHKQNTTLKEIFKELRKQSGYDVLYDKNTITNTKPINVKLDDATITESLNTILKDLPLTYEISNKEIVIKKKPPVNRVTLEQIKQDQIDLIGSVLDTLNQPLAGADISIVGLSNKRAIADASGRFSIKNAPEQGNLLVRLIGYESRNVPYSGSSITIRLKPSVSDLDIVHIIAYGKTSKRLTTGNSGGINAKELETQPINNPLLALSGRVSGVIVTQSTGNAGSGITIRIQGKNSILRGNDPFYVVDGSPYITQVPPTTGGNILLPSGDNYIGQTGGSGNPLSYINPADIESIEVLKDADATAIYGSRAANGAVLITTKKGKAGKTRIDVTAQSGIGRVGNFMDLLSRDQYLEMRHVAKANGNQAPRPTDYDINGVWDTTRSTNWQRELLGGSSHYTDVQASVSGGSSSTTFRLNGGYHRETSVFSNKFSDVKGSVGININHASSDKKFKIQFTGNFLNDNNKLPAADLTNIALGLSPVAPALYHGNGTLNWQRIETNPVTRDSVSTWTNPLSNLLRTYQNQTNNLVSNLNLSYELLKGLSISSNLGYTNTATTEIVRNPLIAYRPEDRPVASRYASYGNARVGSWIVEPQLNYHFTLSNNKIEILAGSTFQKTNTSSQRFTGSGYNSDLVLDDFKSASTITPDGSLESIYKYSAVFARINYNWQDKYILNLTARRDGSSRFGIQNQFHNFGAVGAAWVFSNENLIKKSIPFLSYGKLRGSYGTTGNDQIGDYQFLNLYNVTNYPINYQNITGLSPAGHANPYLQWELTKKLQAGLDVGFLNDRILVNANHFNNRSSNQLIPYALPITTGFQGIIRNLPATVQNSGWEFSLTTINLKRRHFTWSSTANLTASRNKLVAFPNLETSSYADLLIIGEPISILKLYNFAGVNPETGLYQYYDANGKVVTDPSALTDRTKLYKPLQNIYGGLQNSISYKGFQLDVFFQFVKQEARNYDMGLVNRVGLVGFNQPVTVLDRWRKAGDQTNIQKYTTAGTNLGVYAQSSTGSYSDASYIRLKNVSLSWNMPSQWTKTAHLENCRIFLHGQNLLTFTRYKGLDPESLSIASLPPLRVLTFGIQVTL